MSEYQLKAKECKCTGKHVPLPITLKEYKGVVVCPTTFSNIIEYDRIWKSMGNRPPGSIRKHFSDFVQNIVESTINKNEDGTLIGK